MRAVASVLRLREGMFDMEYRDQGFKKFVAAVLLYNIPPPLPERVLVVIAPFLEKSRGSFRRVEHAVVRGRELLAIEVGGGRREQRIDLAPGKEHDTRQDYEQDGVVREVEQRIDADAFE